MKAEDKDENPPSGRLSQDVERGVHFPAQQHSWSSYLVSSPIRFRTPDYTQQSCRAPELAQGEFSDVSPLKVEKNHGQGRIEHSTLQYLPQTSVTMFETHNVTPGILRSEEQQNSLGRCRHYNNRFHSVLDTNCATPPGQKSSDPKDHDFQSAATLVASPVAKALFDKYQAQFAGPRKSTSSSSSYSSQGSETERPVSTHRLIRYYTGLDDDLEDELLTHRVSRFSAEVNPWLGDELSANTSHALHALSPKKPSHDGLPPPYQSKKATGRRPEYYVPYEQARVRRRGSRHRAKDANEAFEKNVYLLKLCKAFLQFGVQAHRLEEYLHTTASKLEITAEFQYVPHCMLMVVVTPVFEWTETHIIKESTSVDLGKLEDVYRVYQCVVDHEQDLKPSIRQLDGIIRRKKRYTNLLLILLHGLAAMCAGTFAFSARPMDFGPLYIFGCLLAILQLLILQTPIRNSHILEVLTSIIIAFSARGLGSIYLGQSTPAFCFSGITQGTIALILPGHIILAATHEIQNRQVLSGSVKMVYAILYTLFLGFGILIGSALYGFLDNSATNATICTMPWYWATSSPTNHWRATYAQFLWVPLFALAISIMHQAKQRHLPAMVVIATCGHQAFYWSLWRFAANLQFAGMIAAFTSGLLANIYAQLTSCLAATILLPAVLVVIPNTLAASGSLVAGVDSADAIVTNATQYLIGDMSSKSAGPGDGGGAQRRVVSDVLGLVARDFVATGPSGSTGLIVTAGFGMAQATIGITVGLFLSAFVVYPFTRRTNKRRVSGSGALAF